jgi:transposase
MSSRPDVTIKHEPEYCNHCGKLLSDIPGELLGKRQVIDIPPILPVITEHQIYRKHCTCRHCTESTYPVEVHSPVCYGENVISLTGYLHARQYLPYDRMSEMFRDVFGLSVSSGTLVNLVSRLSERCTPVYEYIREKLRKSEVVGADETGVCVNGKNQWAWTFQNDKLTYIYIDPSRGRKVIDSVFASGLPQSIMVHDCWKPYFSTDCQTHQICTAHLLRELKYLDKLYNESWTSDFKDLISAALELKRELRETDYLQPVVQRNILETRLDELLLKPVDSKHKKLLAFKDRMIKYRKYLLLFLYHYTFLTITMPRKELSELSKLNEKYPVYSVSEKGARFCRYSFYYQYCYQKFSKYLYDFFYCT